jgi:competence protein ComEC
MQDSLNRDAWDTATVTQFPLRETPALCVVELQSSFSKGETWAIQLPKTHSCPLPGSRIAIRSRTASQKGATAPGGFDAREWLRRQGACRLRSVNELQIVSPPSGRWKWSLELRRLLGDVLRSHIPPSEIALVRSTVLGDMRGLTQQTKVDFQNTGMLHILAISGQHIALMVAIVIQAFQLARLPSRWVALGLGGFLFLYGPATGNSPSVVRSIWMFGLFLPPLLLRKPFSPFTTLSIASTLSLALEPEVLTHIGWQLSYSATLLLLLWAPWSERIGRQWADFLLSPCRRVSWTTVIVPWIGMAFSAFILSSFISLGTLPILSTSSHVFMPVSPLANLVTVPLGSGLLTCAFLTCFLAPLPVLPEWLGMATGFFSFVLTHFVHWLAQWREGLWAFSTWPRALSLVWLGAFFLLPSLPAQFRRRMLWVSIPCLAAYFMTHQVVRFWHGEVRAMVVDVGQGQAVLLELGPTTVLIDAGPHKPDAGFRTLLPALRAWGHNRLDAVLLSHGDADHIGGLNSLLDQVPIGQVALGSTWPDRGLWPGLMGSMRRKNIPFGRLQPGQVVVSYRDWTLRTLDLGPLDSSSRNNASAIICLEGPSGRFVIPGDIEASTERILADTLAAWTPDKPLWLLVPHHGSDRTGDTTALARMKPDWGFISAGFKNRFGHPGPNTLKTLQNVGAKIGLTSTDGSWILTIRRNQARWQAFQVVN